MTGQGHKWSGGSGVTTPLETGKLSHRPLVGGVEAEQAERHWRKVEQRRSKAGADPTFKGVVSLDYLLPRTIYSMTEHLSRVYCHAIVALQCLNACTCCQTQYYLVGDTVVYTINNTSTPATK